MPVLRIDVKGIPGAQGSKRHVGRGIMVESSKKVAPWRSDVRDSAMTAMTDVAWASHGTIAPVSGSWSVRESTSCRPTFSAVLLPAGGGSTHCGSPSSATRKVPPAWGLLTSTAVTPPWGSPQEVGSSASNGTERCFMGAPLDGGF